MFKNPIWQEATRCLFTSPTKGLNSGLPRNHASQRSERDWNSVSTNLGRGWVSTDHDCKNCSASPTRALNTRPHCPPGGM